MMLKRYGSGTMVAGALVALLLAGCTSKHHHTTNTFSEEANHIKAAAKLCIEYTQDPKNAGKDIDSFSAVRKWARKKKKHGVTGDMFRSTRDQQDYVIVPGPMGRLLLHEQSGQGGKVYITTPDGSAMERTPAEVKNMTASMSQSMEHYKP